MWISTGEVEGLAVPETSHSVLCSVMYLSRRLTRTCVLLESCRLNSGFDANAQIGSQELKRAYTFNGWVVVDSSMSVLMG